jgi:hypothetical protein
MPLTPALMRLKQGNYKSEASLDKTPCKTTTTTTAATKNNNKEKNPYRVTD